VFPLPINEVKKPPDNRVHHNNSACRQNVSDPFSKELLNQYDKLYPGSAKFTSGSGCSGLYRGLRLWEAAVKETGSLRQEDVIKALDHAKIAAGPGGSAEMVPGQHHVRKFGGQYSA
jgi:Periplasmic binding protein domain